MIIQWINGKAYEIKIQWINGKAYEIKIAKIELQNQHQDNPSDNGHNVGADGYFVNY